MTIALIKISRPVNVLISFLTIIVAAELAGGLNPLMNVILAAFSAALITIGANVINDYYDIRIDKINKPTRPLASGKLSSKAAITFFSIVYILSWILSLMINFQMFLIAFIFSLLLILYSFKLKRMVFWGNFTVSLTSAMAFIYGGMSVNHIKETIFPAMIAFFFHMGREILKDIQDMDGDKKEGAETFPIKFGIQKSLQLIWLTLIGLVIVTLIPYIFSVYSIVYLLIVIFGVYPVLIYVIWRSWFDRRPEILGKLSALLKFDMIIGLLAIYLS